MELRTNGSAIRAVREALGVQQKALAARAEITAPYLSQIECGVRQPPMDTVRRLATELGVPVDAITYPAPAQPAAAAS